MKIEELDPAPGLKRIFKYEPVNNNVVESLYLI